MSDTNSPVLAKSKADSGTGERGLTRLLKKQIMESEILRVVTVVAMSP
jgi:hypothetical protein